MTAPEKPAEWHDMQCDLCPETWWIPYGQHPYKDLVIDQADRHWRGHVKRGEDPRIQGREIKAYVGGAR